MVTQRLRDKGVARDAIARTSILRGAEIYGLGLLFRVQEFALGYPISPWTDLLRVDVLNILGLSMMLIGVLCWLTDVSVSQSRTSTPTVTIIAALITAAAVPNVTPWLWTSHRPRSLPCPLESHINAAPTYTPPPPCLSSPLSLLPF